MPRRKHSKIDKLPSSLKDTVEQMMQADFTYAEIADYIKQRGYDISVSSVYRHASTLNKTLRDLHFAQENFRVIMDEINRYPQLDTTEGIIRLLSHRVLETIHSMPEENWKDIDPAKLIKEGSALIRAAAYKNNVDIRNMDTMEAGLEQVKVLVFEALAKERPELYKEVSGFLTEKGENL